MIGLIFNYISYISPADLHVFGTWYFKYLVTEFEFHAYVQKIYFWKKKFMFQIIFS